MEKIILDIIPKIKSITNKISNDINYYVEYEIYNENTSIDKNTISIVMTTHNRITQTLFTLDTINKSIYKNIQVIIVDDSNKFIEKEQFTNYHFQIDYLKIKNKDWINPCINYNIGFKYIAGSKIIIQNSEVCHIGDIISYVNNNCKQGEYLVFDVINTGSYANNNRLYKLFPNNIDNSQIKDLIKNESFHWYQHSKYSPYNLHFLTAMNIEDFCKLDKGFDYDFSLGRWYDDNEFHDRIKYILKLNIINIGFDDTKILGIHQNHEKIPSTVTKEEYDLSIKINGYLYQKKFNYRNKHNEWIYLYKEDNIDNAVGKLLSIEHF